VSESHECFHEGPNPLHVNGGRSRTLIVTVLRSHLFSAPRRRCHGPLPEPQDLSEPGSQSYNPDVPVSFHVFWRGFLNRTCRNRGSSLVMPQALFRSGPYVGMRSYNHAKIRRAILDHYTGFGEVLAVHALDSVFERRH